MASTNLPSKLARAVAHYLVTTGDAVGRDRCFAGLNSIQRDLANGPIVTVLVAPGKPGPSRTGNRDFIVDVRIKGNGLNDPADPNEETARLAFDAQVGRVHDALMYGFSGQNYHPLVKSINTAAWTMPVAVDETAAAVRFATNHADMADFTLLHWEDWIYGQGTAEDCLWEIVLQFHATACETKISDFASD